MVEAVPASALGAFAITREIGRSAPFIEHVVFARHMKHGKPRFADDVVRVREFSVLRQVADVTGMEDEVRLHAQCLHL